MKHTLEKLSSSIDRPIAVVEPPVGAKTSSQTRSPRERNHQFASTSLSPRVLNRSNTNSAGDPTIHKTAASFPTREVYKGILHRGRPRDETVLASFGLSDFNATLGRNNFQDSKQGNRNAVSKLEARIQEQLEEINKKFPDTSSQLKLSKARAQIKVLDDANNDLLRQIEVHSTEKAELSRKIWASSGDLHNRIYTELSVVINNLQFQRNEQMAINEKLEEKVDALSERLLVTTSMLQVATGENSDGDAANPNAAVSDKEYYTSTKMQELNVIRQLEEEIKLKTKEMESLTKVITDLSIWFPKFHVFGGSILSKFLPPVEVIALDSELGRCNENNPTDEQGGGSSVGDACVGIESRDSVLTETSGVVSSSTVPSQQMPFVAPIQLAQEALLDDLRRLVDIGIGFQILEPPPLPTQADIKAEESKANFAIQHAHLPKGGAKHLTPQRANLPAVDTSGKVSSVEQNPSTAFTEENSSHNMYPPTSLISKAANAAAAHVDSLKPGLVPTPARFIASSMDSPLRLDRGSSFQEVTENEFNLRHLSVLDPGSPRPGGGEETSHTLMLDDGTVVITAPGTDPSTFLSAKSIASSRKFNMQIAENKGKEFVSAVCSKTHISAAAAAAAAASAPHQQRALLDNLNSLNMEQNPEAAVPFRGHVDEHTPIDNNNNSFGISNEVLHTVVEAFNHRLQAAEDYIEFQDLRFRSLLREAQMLEKSRAEQATMIKLEKAAHVRESLKLRAKVTALSAALQSSSHQVTSIAAHLPAIAFPYMLRRLEGKVISPVDNPPSSSLFYTSKGGARDPSAAVRAPLSVEHVLRRVRNFMRWLIAGSRSIGMAGLGGSEGLSGAVGGGGERGGSSISTSSPNGASVGCVTASFGQDGWGYDRLMNTLSGEHFPPANEQFVKILLRREYTVNRFGGSPSAVLQLTEEECSRIGGSSMVASVFQYFVSGTARKVCATDLANNNCLEATNRTVDFILAAKEACQRYADNMRTLRENRRQLELRRLRNVVLPSETDYEDGCSYDNANCFSHQTSSTEREILDQTVEQGSITEQFSLLEKEECQLRDGMSSAVLVSELFGIYYQFFVRGMENPSTTSANIATAEDISGQQGEYIQDNDDDDRYEEDVCDDLSRDESMSGNITDSNHRHLDPLPANTWLRATRLHGKPLQLPLQLSRKCQQPQQSQSQQHQRQQLSIPSVTENFVSLNDNLPSFGDEMDNGIDVKKISGSSVPADVLMIGSAAAVDLDGSEYSAQQESSSSSQEDDLLLLIGSEASFRETLAMRAPSPPRICGNPMGVDSCKEPHQQQQNQNQNQTMHHHHHHHRVSFTLAAEPPSKKSKVSIHTQRNPQQRRPGDRTATFPSDLHSADLSNDIATASSRNVGGRYHLDHPFQQTVRQEIFYNLYVNCYKAMQFNMHQSKVEAFGSDENLQVLRGRVPRDMVRRLLRRIFKSVTTRNAHLLGTAKQRMMMQRAEASLKRTMAALVTVSSKSEQTNNVDDNVEEGAVVSATPTASVTFPPGGKDKRREEVSHENIHDPKLREAMIAQSAAAASFQKQRDAIAAKALDEAAEEISTAHTPWWLILTESKLTRLQYLIERDAVLDHNATSSTPISMTIDCDKFILRCWSCVRETHRELTILLKQLYRFLMSLFPGKGATSRSFHLLLSFILQQQQKPPIGSSQRTLASRRESNESADGSGSSNCQKEKHHSPDSCSEWSCSWPPVVSQQLSTELITCLHSCSIAAHTPEKSRSMSSSSSSSVQSSSEKLLCNESSAAAFADAVLRTQRGAVMLSLSHLLPSSPRELRGAGSLGTSASTETNVVFSEDVDAPNSSIASTVDAIHYEGARMMTHLIGLRQEVAVNAAAAVNNATTTVAHPKHESNVQADEAHCISRDAHPNRVKDDDDDSNSNNNNNSGSMSPLEETGSCGGQTYSFFKQRILIDEILFPRIESIDLAASQDNSTNSDSNSAHKSASIKSSGTMSCNSSSQHATTSEAAGSAPGGDGLGFVARLLLHARRCFHPDVSTTIPPNAIDCWFTFLALKYVTLSIESLMDTPRWSNLLLNRTSELQNQNLSNDFLSYILRADVPDSDQFCVIEAHYRRSLTSRAFHAWSLITFSKSENCVAEDKNGDDAPDQTRRAIS